MGGDHAPEQIVRGAFLGMKKAEDVELIFTGDEKAIRAACNSFRTNPNFKTEEAIKELGVGEELISFLNEKGEPSLLSLLGKTEYPVYDKYDACLPQNLLIQAYAENRLDLQEVQHRISTLSKEL